MVTGNINSTQNRTQITRWN